MLPGRTLCQIMYQIQPKMGITKNCWFISILLISCLTYPFLKTYRDTGEHQLYSEQIGIFVSIKSCQIMEPLRPRPGNLLTIFVLSILLMLCRPNV